MTIYQTMICASAAAYNIHDQTYTADPLFDPQLQWLPDKKPYAIVGGIEEIDACFVAQNSLGIIVSVRGTLPSGKGSFDDWINDFSAQPVTWGLPNTGLLLPGKVHYGFKGAVFTLYNKLKQKVLTLLQETPTAQVFITGHSKGGGMAPLIAYLFHVESIPVQHIVTFAAPKPGDATFQTFYNRVFEARHHRFENYGDIVPLLWPAGSVINPLLETLINVLNELPDPGPYLASKIQAAETWNYQPVGQELFINWTPLLGQSIITDLSQIAALQLNDVAINLASQYAWDGYSVEYILLEAHTIAPCVGDNPVIGYLSEVYPELCQKGCPASNNALMSYQLAKH